MTEIFTAECVGCYQWKKKDGSGMTWLSHFIYDVPDKGMQAVGTCWDRCEVGELYKVVVVKGQLNLVKEREQ